MILALNYPPAPAAHRTLYEVTKDHGAAHMGDPFYPPYLDQAVTSALEERLLLYRVCSFGPSEPSVPALALFVRLRTFAEPSCKGVVIILRGEYGEHGG